MKALKDIFDQDINAGDIILYTVSHGSGSMSTRLAVIDNAISGQYGYELKVRAYDPNHYVWNYVDGKLIDYTVIQRLRKTALTSNKTIVRLSLFTAPEGFKKLLNASVV